MQCFWFYFHDALESVAGFSARLFRQKGNGIAFVQQPKLSVGLLFGAGIQKNAPFDEVPVEVSHQRTNVARRIRAVRGCIILLAEFDILFDTLRKINVVPLVDGVNF